MQSKQGFLYIISAAKIGLYMPPLGSYNLLQFYTLIVDFFLLAICTSYGC